MVPPDHGKTVGAWLARDDLAGDLTPARLVLQVFRTGEGLRNFGAEDFAVTLAEPVHRGPYSSFAHSHTAR